MLIDIMYSITILYIINYFFIKYSNIFVNTLNKVTESIKTKAKIIVGNKDKREIENISFKIMVWNKNKIISDINKVILTLLNG